MTFRIAPPSKRPAPGTKVRPCITCGAAFHSQGAHNRMCDPCRATTRDNQGFYGLAFSTGRAAVRKTARGL